MIHDWGIRIVEGENPMGGYAKGEILKACLPKNKFKGVKCLVPASTI